MFPWLTDYFSRFQQAYAQHRIPHALLLIGVDGIGKSVLSEEISRLFLCEQPLHNQSCGVCHSCRLTQNKSHPDVHVYGADEARSIGVDVVRELNNMVTKSAQLGRGKVAIVHHAERMTESAANALLKTLEEPSGNTLIILMVDSSMKLLPTIVSRCQQWYIQPSEDIVLSWLAKETNVPLIEPAILRVNHGSPLKALAYLEQKETLSHQVVTQALAQYFHEPWQIHLVTKTLADALPESIDWLIFLLMDAMKLQHQVNMELLQFAHELQLLKLLSEFDPDVLADAVTHLVEMRQSLAEMPSAIPAFLFAEWLETFLSKE